MPAVAGSRCSGTSCGPAGGSRRSRRSSSSSAARSCSRGRRRSPRRRDTTGPGRHPAARGLGGLPARRRRRRSAAARLPRAAAPAPSARAVGPGLGGRGRPRRGHDRERADGVRPDRAGGALRPHRRPARSAGGLVPARGPGPRRRRDDRPRPAAPGYAEHPDRRYPVVVLLPGSPGRSTDWFAAGGAARTVDALTDARLLPPVLVVTPDMDPDLLAPAGTPSASTCPAAAVGDVPLPRPRAGPRQPLPHPGPALLAAARRESAGAFCALDQGLRHRDVWGRSSRSNPSATRARRCAGSCPPRPSPPPPPPGTCRPSPCPRRCRCSSARAPTPPNAPAPTSSPGSSRRAGGPWSGGTCRGSHVDDGAGAAAHGLAFAGRYLDAGAGWRTAGGALPPAQRLQHQPRRDGQHLPALGVPPPPLPPWKNVTTS